MSWEYKDGLYIKSGCYLEPISPLKMDADSYALANDILRANLDRYLENPPLLVPIMRGGSRPFLNISGSIRRMIGTHAEGIEKNVDYVPIKVSRYQTSGINMEGEVRADANDLAQAMHAMNEHDDAIIIDDVFDRGVTCERVKNSLEKPSKRVLVATLYRKPENNKSGIDADYSVGDYRSKTVNESTYPCWIVFPWEIDDHEPELWERLFPDFAGLHPEIALKGRF